MIFPKMLKNVVFSKSDGFIAIQGGNNDIK